MIGLITEENIIWAARIHSASWKESHKEICSEPFLERHTVDSQIQYIQKEISRGKKFYMLTDGEPVGIISVDVNLIENLYVLPEQQRKGYGTSLLRWAVSRCSGIPTLWILSTNTAARCLYEKEGFRLTGKIHPLSETLTELEMAMHIAKRRILL